MLHVFLGYVRSVVNTLSQIISFSTASKIYTHPAKTGNSSPLLSSHRNKGQLRREADDESINLEELHKVTIFLLPNRSESVKSVTANTNLLHFYILVTQRSRRHPEGFAAVRHQREAPGVASASGNTMGLS